MQNTDFFQNNCVKGNKNMAVKQQQQQQQQQKKQKTKQSTDKLLLKMPSRDHKE